MLCLCCAVTVAQATGDDEKMNASDANVFGHVLDKETGEHLPFITVMLKGTTIGTTTDNSGHYFLKNLPEGKFTLEFKYLVYLGKRENTGNKRRVGRRPDCPGRRSRLGKPERDFAAPGSHPGQCHRLEAI